LGFGFWICLWLSGNRGDLYHMNTYEIAIRGNGVGPIHHYIIVAQDEASAIVKVSSAVAQFGDKVSIVSVKIME
jgi:hypothetical protein